MIPIPSKLKTINQYCTLAEYFEQCKELELDHHPLGDPAGTLNEDLPEYRTIIDNHDRMWEDYTHSEIMKAWEEVHGTTTEEIY